MSKLWCVPGYRDGAGSSPKCVVQPYVVGKTTTPCLAVRGTAWASSPTGMGKQPMGSHCSLEAVRLLEKILRPKFSQGAERTACMTVPPEAALNIPTEG